VIVPTPGPGGAYFVGNLSAKVNPVKITISVRHHDAVHVALVGYRPGVHVVVGTAAVPHVVLVTTPWVIVTPPAIVVHPGWHWGHGHGHRLERSRQREPASVRRRQGRQAVSGHRTGATPHRDHRFRQLAGGAAEVAVRRATSSAARTSRRPSARWV
jgi:hypothetical protein